MVWRAGETIMVALLTRSAPFLIAFMLTLCAGIVLTTFSHHPVGATDNSCDGVEVSQSGLFGFGTKQHCIRPGTGAKEWFKDCPECPEMVIIPAGNFMMGGDRAGNERPIHRVTIAKPFAVARYSITVGEFAAFINDSAYQMPRICRGERSMTASEFEKMFGTAKPPTATKYNTRTYSSGNSSNSQGFEQGDRNPVVCATWEDAKAYVDRLTKKTGKPYRLLTEAEYEYAARAGTTTLYFWGEDIGKNRANCDGCGSQWDENRTAPVGSFAANAFGLHEVHGNAANWV